MTAEPRIPFVTVPDLTLVPVDYFGGGFPPIPISAKPFGVLVALGVYLGSWLALKQTRRLGLDERRMMTFILWVVGSGFVLGHVLDTLFYYPGRVLEDPWSVLRLWDGLSSFGGFAGATMGLLVFRWRHPGPTLPYADTVASAFPAAWVFGRAGCALAHDHPGLRSDLWLAVAYPGGGRFDLGLYEMVLTIPLAVTFLFLRRRPRPWGFYLASMCMAYAPVRFALDFLRIRESITTRGVPTPSDPRYGALTPGQWASLVLLFAGAFIFVRIMPTAGTPESTRVPGTPGARASRRPPAT